MGQYEIVNNCEQKLKNWMAENKVQAKHLHFENSVHTVEEACKEANANPEDFVKNICMVDAKGNLIVAIVKGETRASTKRVGKALNIECPRTATPEQATEKTGYPCGGTPSFGYRAIFLIDEKVMEKNAIYTGGGSENSLVKISPKELQKANAGQIARIRK